MGFFCLIKKYLEVLLPYILMEIYFYWTEYLVIPLSIKLLYFNQVGFIKKIYVFILGLSLKIISYYNTELKFKNSFLVITFLLFDIFRSFIFSFFERIIFSIRIFIQFFVEALLFGFFKTIRESRWIVLLKKFFTGFFIGVLFWFFSIPFRLGIFLFFIYIIKNIFHYNQNIFNYNQKYKKSSMKEKTILILESISHYFESKTLAFNQNFINNYEEIFDINKFLDVTNQWSYEIILHRHFLKNEKTLAFNKIKKKIWLN